MRRINKEMKAYISRKVREMKIANAGINIDDLKKFVSLSKNTKNKIDFINESNVNRKVISDFVNNKIIKLNNKDNKDKDEKEFLHVMVLIFKDNEGIVLKPLEIGKLLSEKLSEDNQFADYHTLRARAVKDKSIKIVREMLYNSWSTKGIRYIISKTNSGVGYKFTRNIEEINKYLNNEINRHKAAVVSLTKINVTLNNEESQ